MKHLKLCLVALLALCCVAATIVTIKVSQYPAVTTPADSDLFLIAVAGTTNKNIRFDRLKAAIATNLLNAQIAASAAIARSKIATGNPWDVVINGPDGELYSVDGSSGFLGLSNGIPVFMAVSGAAGETNYYDYAFFTNNFFLSGKGNTLVVTQYVRLPWSTLTLTGTNATAPDLAAASVFKLTLTTNAFVPAPTGLPGTNLAQTIQIAVKQDSSAVRTLTWNSAYKFPGGIAPTMTTNASAVDVFSFVSSPFDATVLYAVPAQNF